MNQDTENMLKSQGVQKQEAIWGSASPFGGAPYTPAVRAGNTLYISGQLGLDPDTKKPLDDFEKQVEGCIHGIKALVESAGGTLASVVKTTVFLSDIALFARFNAVYAQHFDSTVRPARSTFQVAALPAGASVEIEAVAYLP